MQARTGRIIDRTVAALLGLPVALNEKEVPPSLAEYFADRPWQIIALLVAAGLFAAFMPVESLASRGLVEPRLVVQRPLLTRLGELVALAQATVPQVGIADPGLHVWRRRRSVLNPVQGRLKRVGFFRLGDHPVNVPFEPSVGVGVVGMCMKENKPQGYDVAALAARLDSEQRFATEKARDPDAVMNLDWETFEKGKHRGAVFAAPIRNSRGKFVGCVSVDVSRGYPELEAAGVPELAATAAAGLGPSNLHLL